MKYAVAFMVVLLFNPGKALGHDDLVFEQLVRWNQAAVQRKQGRMEQPSGQQSLLDHGFKTARTGWILGDEDFSGTAVALKADYLPVVEGLSIAVKLSVTW